jgi:hypothetical protein
MTNYCPVCEQLLKEGDTIVATVLASFAALKSDRIYAINNITDCFNMVHQACAPLSDNDYDTEVIDA